MRTFLVCLPFFTFTVFTVYSLCKKISSPSTVKKFAKICIGQEMAKGPWLHGTGEKVVSILRHNRWFSLNHKCLVNIHACSEASNIKSL